MGWVALIFVSVKVDLCGCDMKKQSGLSNILTQLRFLSEKESHEPVILPSILDRKILATQKSCSSKMLQLKSFATQNLRSLTLLQRKAFATQNF